MKPSKKSPDVHACKINPFWVSAVDVKDKRRDANSLLKGVLSLGTAGNTGASMPYLTEVT